MLMHCKFESIGEEWQCEQCGFATKKRSEKPPHKNCDAAKNVSSSPQPQPQSQPRLSLECIYRGEQIRSETCKLCGGREKQVPVYSCSLHGECALSRTKPGSKDEIRQCLTCQDRQEPPLVQITTLRGEWRWEVGITTSPRRIPTLSRTVKSLREAGWENPHIFSEPGVNPLKHCVWHQNKERLGGWPNFVSMAKQIVEIDADAYLLLQDDVLLSPNLRAYLESTSPPRGAACLSPYTSSKYHRDGWGWHTARYKGLVGALAFIFTKDKLRSLLASPWAREKQSNGIDTFIGRWAKRNGGIQFHSPSLCEHIGDTSTIHGGASNSGQRHSKSFVGGLDLGKITRPPVEGREPRVGIIGYNSPTGLGSCNSDAVANLPISRWLVLDNPSHPTLPAHNFCEIFKRDELHKFMLGLDALLFFERPLAPQMLELAKAFGVRTTAVAMQESLPPGAKGWPQKVDVVICPTVHCYGQIAHVLKNTHYVPWPIDASRWTYRNRARCNRFVFSCGGSTLNDRKGAKIVAAAAWLAPEIPLTVFNFGPSDIVWPSHVEIRGLVSNPQEIYEAGDVAIQPSRYEGLGLSLLEAKACGLPLITTSGDPMCEYAPMRMIRSSQEKISVRRTVTAFHADPEHLAELMREVYQKDIAEDSEQSRAYIEQFRSWDAHRTQILEHILGRQPKKTSTKALATFGVGSHEELLRLALPSFRRYAEAHGYDLQVVECVSRERPVSWAKIPAMQRLLRSYDEVLWVDADAVIADASRDIADEIPQGAAQAVVLEEAKDGPRPNCGVWFVRKAMLPWLNLAWEQTQFVHHPWWEQAAISHLMGFGVNGTTTSFPANPSELFRKTHFLAPEWNVRGDQGRILHAMGRPTEKRELMERWLGGGVSSL